MSASFTFCLCVTSYQKKMVKLLQSLIDNLWIDAVPVPRTHNMLFSASVVIIYVPIFLSY